MDEGVCGFAQWRSTRWALAMAMGCGMDEEERKDAIAIMKTRVSST